MTRVTLDLDTALVDRLAREAESAGRTLSHVANEVLRAGFQAHGQSPSHERYEPPVFDCGRSLVDVTGVASALATLDAPSGG